MKTLVLGFFFLGFTNLMIAQNDLVAVTDSNQSLYSNSTKSMKNIEYVNTVKQADISKKIVKLQKMIANYNIQTDKVYRSKRNTTYTVNFSEGDNKLQVIYDRHGKLLSSQENYQAIKLPYALSSELIKANPGWTLNQVHCSIQYNIDSEAKIEYKVVLKNENRKTKTVIINI